MRNRHMTLAWSREALADYAGIDRSRMGRIERNVTLLNLPRIARAIECKSSGLLVDAGL